METEYFLVGGFDNNEFQGKIKLFKFKKTEKISDVKIECLQDIKIKRKGDFTFFGGAISSIIQSTKQLNILVSCFDGNVYLLSQPNLNFYSGKKDKKEKT